MLAYYNDQKIIETKMKISIQSFIFIAFILFLNCSKDHNDDKRQKAIGESEIEITYINNEGFIITAKEKKIIIDGLLNFVSKENQNKMIKQETPFNNIDLILTTHDHADHFDAKIVGKHLLNNKKGVFISTEQALEELQTEFTKFNKISDRAMSTYPKEGEKVSKRINGIEIDIFNFRHGMNSSIQNLGFIIHLAGKQILHIGDAQKITKDDLKLNGIYDKRINIAFMPYWNLIPEYDQNVFQDIIHDSDVIAMHLGWVEEGIETAVNKLEIECPDVIIFKEFLEMKTFK